MADKGAPKELLELDPNEVSLVSKPAIRRTFVRVKSEEGEPVGETREATRKRRTAAVATSKEDAPTTVQIDVEKAGEIISALTQDYLSVVVERVNALKGLISSGGSIERDELWSYMGGIFQALYKAEDQIMILATNIGMSEDVVKAAVSKADRKMTKRRRAELKAAATTLMGLLKELEDDMGAEGTETDTTEKTGDQPATETQPAAKSADGTQPAPAATVTAEVTKAVTDALGPVITAAVAKGIEPVSAQLATLTERVAKLEAPAAPAAGATETQPAAKSEADPSEAIRIAVEKAVKPLADRLANLESGSAQGAQNATEQQPTAKGAGDSIWSGVV